MGTKLHYCLSNLLYTPDGKKKTPFSAPGKKREKAGPYRPGFGEAPRYFWKVTPTTATLTQATPSPLVFSTALNTASCTARATSVTT